ncbi:MAG: hypothetical protein K6346_03720 [Halothiobacillaceae bacterium]
MSKYPTRRQTPPRRTLLLGGLTLALSACGFQPRGMVELPPVMQRVHLGGHRADHGLAGALARLVQQNGGEMVSDARAASLRLTILHEQTNRREAVIDPRARLRELELIQRVVLKAEDAQGAVLLKNESFEATRMMHYDPLNLLGQGEEEARLRSEMQETLAQAIFARLRSLANAQNRP